MAEADTLLPDRRLARRLSSLRSAAVVDIVRLGMRPDVLSLAAGFPAVETFPTRAFALASRAALRSNVLPYLQYSQNEGLPELRDWISARLACQLSIAASASNILITHGSQQALDCVARAILNPGDFVAIDQATYHSAISVFQLAEANLVTVPVDQEGTESNRLADLMAKGLRIKLFYTTVNFHNPTGATLSLERRKHLASLAERYDFLIVEDDPYYDLRYQGRSLQSIATLTDRTVRLGSFSKILFPGLRLGYMSAPRWLVPALVHVKQATDLHTSGWSQRLILEMTKNQDFLDRHIRRLVRTYRQRCKALTCALTQAFGGDLTFAAPQGGLYVWARLTDSSLTADSLLSAAVNQGVIFFPGSAFFPAECADVSAMRLCFTMLNPNQLVEAVHRLRLAYNRVCS